MPGQGRPWRRERDAFKAECARQGAPCWLCKGTRGPIDYTSAYDPKKRNNLAFTVDHATPTSLGGDMNNRANWRPAHAVCNVSRGNTTRGQYPNSRAW